ncbi:hypothetical protein L486_06219 [Kwoniella mangroviensis CBS 10435]|uniref:Uncharacterized protein n=1 Tax=Kwoniella mangroviensis CBS 10435 TaxID=1331196 RepID=A0A1B9IKT7_9TREE|nr:hypothetical protein L486_06219 [Kwoniella mangroviensis CBS 10435]
MANPSSKTPPSLIKMDSKGKGKAKALPPSKRPRASTPPSSNSSSHSDSEDDEGDVHGNDTSTMLALLEAQSRAMLGLAPLPTQGESSTASKGKKRALEGSDHDSESGSGLDDDDEEEQGEEYISDDGWGAEDGFVTDSEDEFAIDQEALVEEASKVPEVIFDGGVGSKRDMGMSKAERKAFMNGNSAKMMGLQPEDDGYNTLRKNKRARAGSEEDDLDEQSNLKLDQILHKMLLTNLLPSDTLDKANRPSEKRNHLQGRLRELASFNLPGEGISSLRSTELSKHPAHIRTAIMQKAQKREKAQREEQRAAGNIDKRFGGLSDGGGKSRGGREVKRADIGKEVGKKKGMQGRTKDDSERARGLSLGVGKFSNGMLKLSSSEIQSVNGAGRGDGGRRGGRGGKRGGKRR